MTDEEIRPVKKQRRTATLISVLLVAMILAGVVLSPLYNVQARQVWYDLCGGLVQYPYVLVHGLGGFGESEDDLGVDYWGATTGSLPDYLRSLGYNVQVPTVGPYSSTWDRTCELYAQLTGTTVDYGEAHSKAHNHARFGRAYSEAMVPEWGQRHNGGQRIKVNLVGHSFGGATVRLLTSLLAEGNQAEINATGSDTSPLFTGDKKDWVFSVTTLCAPHNGSQLTCIVDEIGSVAGIKDTTQLLVSLMFKAVQSTSSKIDMTDLMLDQFGIGKIENGEEAVTETLQQLEGLGNDHAFYDLSPDGAAELNQTIETVKNVYYFSYAYSTVSEGSLLGGKVPKLTTLPIMMPTALAMGAFKGTTPGGIEIDESWQDNDGLVSVCSAQYPTGEEHTTLSEANIEKGVWNVADTREGDHGTAVGLNADREETHNLYKQHFSMIDNLKR